MDQPPSGDTDRRRRALCLDFLARARCAPLARREVLLMDAAIVAALHEQLTGTPLLSDLQALISAIRRLPPAPG